MEKKIILDIIENENTIIKLITKVDGYKYEGTVLEVTDTTLKLNDIKAGIIAISLDQIVKVWRLD